MANHSMIGCCQSSRPANAAFHHISTCRLHSRSFNVVRSRGFSTSNSQSVVGACMRSSLCTLDWLAKDLVEMVACYCVHRRRGGSTEMKQQRSVKKWLRFDHMTDAREMSFCTPYSKNWLFSNKIELWIFKLIMLRILSDRGRLCHVFLF
jgi:hypothetical protein